MVLAGNYEVIPENKIDPVNDIPRFMGQPIGGPVYSDVKPTPWIQARRAAWSPTPATAPAAKTPWP